MINVIVGIMAVVLLVTGVVLIVQDFRASREKPWWHDSNEIRCVNRGCGKLFTEHEIDLNSQLVPHDQDRQEADFNGAAWGGRWTGLYCPRVKR